MGYADAFYMFGGDTKTGETDLIFKYRGLIWTDVGELMKPRAGHRKDFNPFYETEKFFFKCFESVHEIHVKFNLAR